MPLRVKWYKASPLDQAGLDTVFAGFVKNEYSRRRKWGFCNLGSRGSFIDGQYVERIETTIRIQDPFGKTLEFPQVEFERFIFSIRLQFPHVEVFDAPRSINPFFTQIATYLNFKVAIEAVNVDLVRWVDALQNYAQGVHVTGALLTNIALSNSVHAKIALTGTEEVRPMLKTIVAKRPYSFAKVQVSGTLRTEPFRCDLFPEGRVSINEGSETELVKVLRSALINASDA